jgi:hypothetical protein
MVDTLHYLMRDDAVEVLDNRKAMNDATNISGLKRQFGLSLQQ